MLAEHSKDGSERKTNKEANNISPDDEVRVTVSDELIPPQFTIQLMEQDMLAMLTFTPGKKVKRTLRDTEFKQKLQIEVDEDNRLLQ